MNGMGSLCRTVPGVLTVNSLMAIVERCFNFLSEETGGGSAEGCGCDAGGGDAVDENEAEGRRRDAEREQSGDCERCTTTRRSGGWNFLAAPKDA